MTSSYSANILLTAEAKGRGLSLSAGLVVAPGGFARLEARDPMGSTLLVLVLSPRSGRLLSPDLRQEARWEEATNALPWSPSEFWYLLSGEAPLDETYLPGLRKGKNRSSWKGTLGKVVLRSEPSEERVFPPARASLRGPGAARLAVAWRTVYADAPPRDALLPPPVAEEQVPLETLLGAIW